MGKSVLITGGTGFIGSRLALTCLERGFRTVVLGQVNNDVERQNRELLERHGARVVVASVTDDLGSRLDFSDLDVVIHLAAAQHEMNIPDETFWAVNVEGTKRLLEQCARFEVGRFVHGSTIGVYGVPTGVLDEQSPCRPDNIYGRTKLEGEKEALARRQDLPVVVVRIPEVYGPGDRRLLKLFQLVEKGRFPLVGDGGNLHHLIYISDLVEGLLLAAEDPAAVGEVFLLAGERPITTDEMVGTVARVVGTRPPGMHWPLLPFLWIATALELALRPLGIQPPLHRRRLDFYRKSFRLSAEHARGTVGFVPRVSFEEGARRTAEYYRSQGLLRPLETQGPMKGASADAGR